MTVAIIIPCHERDRAFLGEAIASTAPVDADVHVLISTLPLSVTLNRLIWAAYGAEYIVRLDADDVIADAGVLRHVLAYLDAYPSVHLAYGALDGFDRANPPGADAIFRRSLWEALGGYDEGLRHQEAVDFEIRARRLHPNGVAYLEAGWYGYRRRPHSMSADLNGVNEARIQISRKLGICLEPLCA